MAQGYLNHRMDQITQRTSCKCVLTDNNLDGSQSSECSFIPNTIYSLDTIHGGSHGLTIEEVFRCGMYCRDGVDAYNFKLS